MRVLVCGGRDYDNRDHIWNTLCHLDAKRRIEVIVHGCAPGADTEGMLWAQANNRKHAPFAADWKAHGRAAGPIRNARMLEEGKPDFVLAFPGGRGTKDMIEKAERAGVRVVRAREVK